MTSKRSRADLKSTVGALEYMASGMQVLRMPNEKNSSFYARAAYSCARPWVSAFCMDDGADGTRGIAKQGINARLRRWLRDVDSLFPGIQKWFDVSNGKLSRIYERLIDIDDIVEDGLSTRFRARSPELIPISEGYAIVVGAYDMSVTDEAVCGIPISKTVTSGLCTVVRTECVSPPALSHWWETDLSTMAWSRINDVGEVRYLNTSCNAWGLRTSEAWQESPVWIEGITLAALKTGMQGAGKYFIARPTRGSVMLSEIDWFHAAELWLKLRRLSNRCITVRAIPYGRNHIYLKGIPIRMLPITLGRYVDAMTWPVERIDDDSNRIIRKEIMTSVANLLERCDVMVREA